MKVLKSRQGLTVFIGESTLVPNVLLYSINMVSKENVHSLNLLFLSSSTLQHKHVGRESLYSNCSGEALLLWLGVTRMFGVFSHTSHRCLLPCIRSRDLLLFSQFLSMSNCGTVQCRGRTTLLLW